MTFRISTVPLDPPALARELLDLRAGAYVEFQGWVRNHNEGQPVEALEYESYVALAEKEGARILAEVATRTTILGAACVHRTGRLQLGELAVWVGVTAAHRGDAFDACPAHRWQDLVKLADANLLVAKAAGRGCVPDFT